MLGSLARVGGAGDSSPGGVGGDPAGAQIVLSAHPPGWRVSPSTPSRARLTAAASGRKSAVTFGVPRTRACRPPCHPARAAAVSSRASPVDLPARAPEAPLPASGRRGPRQDTEGGRRQLPSVARLPGERRLVRAHAVCARRQSLDATAMPRRPAPGLRAQTTALPNPASRKGTSPATPFATRFTRRGWPVGQRDSTRSNASKRSPRRTEPALDRNAEIESGNDHGCPRQLPHQLVPANASLTDCQAAIRTLSNPSITAISRRTRRACRACELPTNRG